jgi:hypothetical protein
MNWMPEITRANLRELVLAWFVLFGILIVSQWWSKRAVGLPVAYAVSLSLIHLVGALSYCFDYYTPISPIIVQVGVSMKATFIGFYVSVIGFAAFVLGSIVGPFVFRKDPPVLLHKPWPQVTSKLPGTLLLMAFFFFFFGPILKRIPSMAAITSVGANISVVSVTLFCHLAYRSDNTKRFCQWMSSTAALPFVTIIFMGFAGYGMIAAASVWQMVLSFFRPRWLGFLMLLAMGYGGISLYVNYMRERGSIRTSVWGESGFGARLEKMQKIITEFEFFNPYLQAHLETVDLRLNQNDLIGRSVTYIEGNRVGFAEGGTLTAAATAWIPRILWPNKPKTGGSGQIVSRFTGMTFGDVTSVGIGQVMEFYVNWGMPSVIIGFFLYGLLMRFFDMRSAFYLHVGDYWTFTRWILPALCMMMAGGILTEIVGSMAAGYVLVTALNWWFFSPFYNDRGGNAPASGTPRGSRWINHSPS